MVEFHQRQICFNKIFFKWLSQLSFNIKILEDLALLHIQLLKKLWQNLCSFKWLNFNRSLDDNLMPTGWWIAKRDFCFELENSLNIDLICLILLASLIELSSLHHSLLTEKGKNNCLKCSILALYLLTLFGVMLLYCKPGFGWCSHS